MPALTLIPGSHIDSVNAAGQTPLAAAATGVAEIILKSQVQIKTLTFIQNISKTLTFIQNISNHISKTLTFIQDISKTLTFIQNI